MSTSTDAELSVAIWVVRTKACPLTASELTRDPRTATATHAPNGTAMPTASIAATITEREKSRQHRSANSVCAAAATAEDKLRREPRARGHQRTQRKPYRVSSSGLGIDAPIRTIEHRERRLGLTMHDQDVICDLDLRHPVRQPARHDHSNDDDLLRLRPAVFVRPPGKRRGLADDDGEAERGQDDAHEPWPGVELPVRRSRGRRNAGHGRRRLSATNGSARRAQHQHRAQGRRASTVNTAGLGSAAPQRLRPSAPGLGCRCDRSDRGHRDCSNPTQEMRAGRNATGQPPETRDAQDAESWRESTSTRVVSSRAHQTPSEHAHDPSTRLSADDDDRDLRSLADARQRAQSAAHDRRSALVSPRARAPRADAVGHRTRPASTPGCSRRAPASRPRRPRRPSRRRRGRRRSTSSRRSPSASSRRSAPTAGRCVGAAPLRL